MYIASLQLSFCNVYYIADVTYVHENLFVMKRGDILDSDELIVNLINMGGGPSRKRQTNVPSLNVNVTLEPDRDLFRVPREHLMVGQTYFVQVC